MAEDLPRPASGETGEAVVQRPDDFGGNLKLFLGKPAEVLGGLPREEA